MSSNWSASVQPNDDSGACSEHVPEGAELLPSCGAPSHADAKLVPKAAELLPAASTAKRGVVLAV
eukprot:15240682-Alexandrium_andersonii.AAC.1